MELYEVPITWETPPPVAIPENIPPTPVPAPPMQNYEQPLDYLMSNPELRAAMLNFPHFYMEPLEEPPVLTMDEMIAQERDRLLGRKPLLRPTIRSGSANTLDSPHPVSSLVVLE
ncbi:hypothetical protein RHGRI_011075 [Rhododendron griersonianum]|uniref:Uncharacterized protein n=1 Tax=Rhododendron griersonianum TaxID=479676 RepID=A0AAV6KKI6_9ERIC|nr:hypothetical protein RHGRI_011075 [Rhododendron griersonianum]